MKQQELIYIINWLKKYEKENGIDWNCEYLTGYRECLRLITNYVKIKNETT